MVQKRCSKEEDCQWHISLRSRPFVVGPGDFETYLKYASDGCTHVRMAARYKRENLSILLFLRYLDHFLVDFNTFSSYS